MAVNNPGSSSHQPHSRNIVIIQTLSTNSYDSLATFDVFGAAKGTIEISRLLAGCITDAFNRTCHYSAEEITEMLSVPQNIPMILHYQDMGHQQHWLEAANRLTEFVKQEIEFAKMAPGFKRLTQNDQILLLKAGAFEMVVIRVSRQFDPGTHSVLFDETLLSLDAFPTEDNTEIRLLTSVFQVARALAEMKLNDTQLGLYSAYVLFLPDRPGLTGREATGKLNAAVLRALRIELAKTYTDPITGEIPVLDALLALVPQLKELSYFHLEALRNLRRAAPILYRDFPPVHKEIFSLDP